jgi:transposase
MADTWEELVGDNKSAKDLFKLIVKRGGVTVDEAAKALDVGEETVQSWAKILASKKYALTEGEGPQMKIGPTEEILSKFQGYREKFKDAEIREGSIIENELKAERNLRLKLQSELEDKRHIIDSLQAEIVAEKKKAAEMGERIAKPWAESAPGSSQELAEKAARYEREHEERLKLEELLRKKQEELDIQVRRPQEPVPRQAPEQLAAAPATPLVRPAIAAPEVAAPSAPSDSAVAKPRERKAPAASEIDSNDVESLIRLLASKDSVSFKDASKELTISEDMLKRLADEVRPYGVAVKKGFLGGGTMSLDKEADVEDIVDKIQAKKVKEELQRMRGGL